jgi:rRNA maturation protein Nop10
MKRKYARMGEKVVSYQCTNKKCKWIGIDEEKVRKNINNYTVEHVCPNCGNYQFYGLL